MNNKYSAYCDFFKHRWVMRANGKAKYCINCKREKIIVKREQL